MFKRFNKSAVAAVVLVAGFGVAHAEGFYAGANLGSPDYHSRIDGISGDGSGVGGKLYGGYQVSPNFAVEAGGFDIGHIDNASGKVNVRGVFVDGVGSYEFVPKWSVIGRAGVANARFTTSNDDDSSPALKLGAGVQYDFNKQVAMRAEYERYHFSNAFDEKPNVGEFSVGVKVGF